MNIPGFEKSMREERNRRNVLIGFSILSLIIIVLIIFSELGREEPDLQSIIQNIGLSIVCSLTSSFIFLYMQKGIEKDESNELRKQLLTMHDELIKQSQLYGSGVIDIRRKVHYDNDKEFWKKILYDTENQIDMIGHSISNWFREEYRQSFSKKMKEMINEGKKIRIILSCKKEDYHAENIKDALLNQKKARDLISKIDKTCFYFVNILKEVEEKQRDNLEIYIVDIEKITYMYIRTDCQCIVSPYLVGSDNRDISFLAEFAISSEFSGYFADDFEHLISDNEDIKCLDWNKEFFS